MKHSTQFSCVPERKRRCLWARHRTAHAYHPGEQSNHTDLSATIFKNAFQTSWNEQETSTKALLVLECLLVFFSGPLNHSWYQGSLSPWCHPFYSLIHTIAWRTFCILIDPWFMKFQHKSLFYPFISQALLVGSLDTKLLKHMRTCWRFRKLAHCFYCIVSHQGGTQFFQAETFGVVGFSST